MMKKLFCTLQFKFYVLLLIFYTFYISHYTIFCAETGNMTVKTKVIEGIWELFDDCDSRFWEDPRWGWGSWQRKTDLTWVTIGSTQCLQLSSTDTYNAMVVRTKTFPVESWNNVDLVRMYVYVECPVDTTDLKFEPKDANGNTIENISYNDLPAYQWIDCVWNIDQSLSGYNNVRQLIFVPDSLGTNPCTYYFENLRLVKTDGTTWYWDDFNDDSYIWNYSGDAENVAESAITNNLAPTNLNAGRVYMKWSANQNPGVTWAKVETKDLGDKNMSRYVKVKADIRCSSTAAQVCVGFWDGARYIETITKTVTTAYTWQTVEWDIPAGSDVNFGSINNISFLIKNTDIVTTGEIWIDNIMFLK